MLYRGPLVNVLLISDSVLTLSLMYGRLLVEYNGVMILQAGMIIITHGMFFTELPRVVILREFNNCEEGL